MNDELTAAERVQRCEAGETLIVVYGTDTWPLAKVAYREDCERLAISYLARLAADARQAREDAAPITEEWCVERGANEVKDAKIYRWRFGNLRVEWDASNGATIDEGDDEWMFLKEVKTRVQLRKLLEALKVGDA